MTENLSAEQPQLYKLLLEVNKQHSKEIKAEIQQIVSATEDSNKEVVILQRKCLHLERFSRKNHIIIFGVKNFNVSEDNLAPLLTQLGYKN